MYILYNPACSAYWACIVELATMASRKVKVASYCKPYLAAPVKSETWLTPRVMPEASTKAGPEDDECDKRNPARRSAYTECRRRANLRSSHHQQGMTWGSLRRRKSNRAGGLDEG